MLTDQNIALIFGTTGSGKSTLANSIIHGPNSMHRNQNGLIENKIQVETLNQFKIGHKVVSETKAPNF